MKIWLMVVVAIVVTAISSMAAPCVPAPLTTYTAGGFSCEVDSAVFSNFSFFLQNAGGGDVLGEADITVSPVVETDIVGLRFSGDFQSTGGPDGPGIAEGIRINAYRFFFEVTRPGSVFTTVGARLNDPFRFAPNPAKHGAIFASNLATNDAAQAFAFDTTPGLTDFVPLFSERVVVPVDNMIHLAAGASAAGTAAPPGFVSLSSADYLFEYRELEVPEPTVWALSAVAALLILRRRLQ